MSIVRDSLRKELSLAVTLSEEYSANAKSARTKTKNTYFTKKLKKNNNLIANMIIALDKIEKRSYNNEKLN